MTKISIVRRKDPDRPSSGRGRKRIDRNGNLYAVFYLNRERVTVPTGISVSKEDWDGGSERIRGRSQKSNDLNLLLMNIVARITETLVKLRLSEKRPTRQMFRQWYDNGGDDDSFVTFARAHLSRIQAALQFETWRKHDSTIRMVNEYSPGIRLSEITPEWLRVYAAHLRDDVGNMPGTIHKRMGMIRIYILAALREGKIRSNPFDAFRMPHVESRVVYLTEEELERLIRLFRSDTLDDIPQKVLRGFLFMTFTGMHISDAQGLLINNIYDGEIHYRRKKTGTSVRVPVSEPARKLVDYYRRGRTRGMLIEHPLSNQCFNRHIKVICSMAGIGKAVSAKTARHTFATIYYRRNRGDIGTLSKLLGHTSVKNTMIYAHITRDSRVEGMSVFDDML